MAFFGVFSDKSEARARFEGRAHYLYAPVLHYSMDGRVALCHDAGRSLTELLCTHPALFVATAAGEQVSLGGATVAGFYKRYGKRFRRYLPAPAAFAVYDAHKGALFLGGAKGEKCYLEEADGALFFSSEPRLLRSPIPVDLALLK